MEEKKNTGLQSVESKNNLLLPFIATLIGSLMLMLTLFMPFASAKDEYKEYLQEYSDKMYAKEINMTNGEAVHLSLFEYGRMYAAAADLGMAKNIAIACLVIISVFALFAILTTLFSVLKKPIAAIIFDILTFGVFLLIKWDFRDRGVLPSNRYDWGMAEYICYIGIAVVIVASITLLISQINNKKQNKALHIE